MCIYDHISLILLRIKNVTDKILEKIETHVVYSITLSFLIVPFVR